MNRITNNTLPGGLFWAMALSLITLAAYLAFWAQRTEFEAFIGAYGLFFLLYWWIAARSQFPVAWLLALGIALRVMWIFSEPNFSDDYFRFLWDGRLTAAGYHPFLHPPRYFIEQGISIPGIHRDLLMKLNSPDYHTVYPPVCQAVFAVAGFVAPEQEAVGLLILKAFLFSTEMATLWLLWSRFRSWGDKPYHPVVLYALNPLVLFEIMGNVHFEGAMICGLVAGMLALEKFRPGRAAAYWALATASKLLPLMMLPAVWRYLGLKRGWLFMFSFGLATLILFMPLLAVLPQMAQSLDLYFRQFQFNASFYYLVRAIGYREVGWDIGEQSGPWLGVAGMVGILLLGLYRSRDNRQLAVVLLFSLFWYFSMAAVVQPWYVCVPLAISLFTPWRFALLWSGLVALSYSHYDDGFYRENYLLIAVEYSLLWAFLLWEIRCRERREK